MSAPSLRSITSAAILSGGLLLAGCGAGPDYQRPALPAAAGYGGDAQVPAATVPDSGSSAALQLVSGQDIPAAWWQVFHSADLDALVALSLKNNPTITAALAALRAAHEQVLAQQGYYYPTASASIQPGREKVARTLASPLASGNSIFNLTTSQVSISYTPDLFGGNARAVESLVAQEDQQRYGLEAARLTLASNVALAAIEDALLRSQIELTRGIIAEQQQMLRSFQEQYRLGQASGADLAGQEASLAQAQAALPPLVKQFRINRDQLLALVGRTPGEVLDLRFDLQAFVVPDQLPLSLPAQLVEHRPDVLIAGEQLHAACAQIGVAEAARWPSLQIDAAGGTAALALLPELDAAARFFSITGTLSQTLFDGGTLRHRQHAAEAEFDQAAALYQSTVLQAFQNTADTLHALWTDTDALHAAEAVERAELKALVIADRQLALGDIDLLVALASRQAEAQARVALLQVQANRDSDVVALFQALGGGWWNREPHRSQRGQAAP
jgi:NodT family efflux transporter outer membrane factor (OMF) lipoprotein